MAAKIKAHRSLLRGKTRKGMLRTACAALAEHFDSVVIVTTSFDAGGSRADAHRTGNFYACRASLEEYHVAMCSDTGQEDDAGDDEDFL